NRHRPAAYRVGVLEFVDEDVLVAWAEGLADVFAADGEAGHRSPAPPPASAAHSGEHVVERGGSRRDERLADMAQRRAIGEIGPFKAGLRLAAQPIVGLVAMGLLPSCPAAIGL